MTTTPRWILERAVLAIHNDQILRFGGGSGIRDIGLLQSALARPQNLLAYEENPDLAVLAAAYAFGIVRNHPFVDGNKRTAFVTMDVFLKLNGYDLVAGNATCVTMMETLAAATITEPTFASWLRTTLTDRPKE